MSKRVFVGNLPWTLTEAEFAEFFTAAGVRVKDTKIVTDRETGRSRGFGFVGVYEEDFDKALALNGTDLGGRSVNVNEAEAKPQYSGSGGGGGGGAPRGNGGGGGDDRRGGGDRGRRGDRRQERGGDRW